MPVHTVPYVPFCRYDTSYYLFGDLQSLLMQAVCARLRLIRALLVLGCKTTALGYLLHTKWHETYVIDQSGRGAEETVFRHKDKDQGQLQICPSQTDWLASPRRLGGEWWYRSRLRLSISIPNLLLVSPSLSCFQPTRRMDLCQLTDWLLLWFCAWAEGAI